MDADSSAAILPVQPAASAGRTPWLETWVGLLALAAVTASIAMFFRRHGGSNETATAPPGSGLFLPVLCLGVLLVAAGFDAATHRIPNPLTYTGILVGLLLNCLGLLLLKIAPAVSQSWLGAAGPTESALGLLLFGGIGVIGVFFAGMGGGDMKLLGAVGAMLGLSRAADVLICGAAVAVLYALVELLVAGRLSAVFRIAASHLLNLLYLRQWTLGEETAKPGRRRTIPLAVPLLAGMLLAQVPSVAGVVSWLIRPS